VATTRQFSNNCGHGRNLSGPASFGPCPAPPGELPPASSEGVTDGGQGVPVADSGYPITANVRHLEPESLVALDNRLVWRASSGLTT